MSTILTRLCLHVYLNMDIYMACRIASACGYLLDNLFCGVYKLFYFIFVLVLCDEIYDVCAGSRLDYQRDFASDL